MNVSVPPEMWDQLYSNPDYMFGIHPNQYFAQRLAQLSPGLILLPGDGEGRNAVHAALKGWQVSANDLSNFGKMKADQLAKENHVSIDFQVGDVLDLSYPKASFDCIALIFAHFPFEHRRTIHQRLSGFLKKGGHLIVEGFARPPMTEDIRYNLEELIEDFRGFKWEEATTAITNLSEGFVINGVNEVVRLFGKKI